MAKYTKNYAWPHYHVELVRVKDGDTSVFMIDGGFGGYQKVSIRILGIDTPEHKSYSGYTVTEAEKQHAREATEHAEWLLSSHPIRLWSYKGKTFDRWLGRVEVWFDGQWRNYADIMRLAGFEKREDYPEDG